MRAGNLRAEIPGVATAGVLARMTVARVANKMAAPGATNFLTGQIAAATGPHSDVPPDWAASRQAAPG